MTRALPILCAVSLVFCAIAQGNSGGRRSFPPGVDQKPVAPENGSSDSETDTLELMEMPYMDLIANEWIKAQVEGSGENFTHSPHLISIENIKGSKKWTKKKYCVHNPGKTKNCMKAQMKKEGGKNSPMTFRIHRVTTDNEDRSELLRRVKRDYDYGNFGNRGYGDDDTWVVVTDASIRTEYLSDTNIKGGKKPCLPDSDENKLCEDDSEEMKPRGNPGRYLQQDDNTQRRTQDSGKFRLRVKRPQSRQMQQPPPVYPQPPPPLVQPDRSGPEWARCILPKGRDTVEIFCTRTEGGVACNLYCVHGYTFPEGITRKNRCSKDSNDWTAPFDECKPFVDCTMKLSAPGFLKCVTNRVQTGTTCNVMCERFGIYLETASQQYVCQASGRWNPNLPNCVKRQGIVLVSPPSGPIEHPQGSMTYP